MVLDTVVLKVTDKCPFNCSQCYMKHGSNELLLQNAKNAIDEAIGYGIKAVQITGGEPVCYSKLDCLLGYVKSKGLFSVMATSGYLCSCELYTRLKDSGLDIICISLNSISEMIDNVSRQSYANAISAIKAARSSGLLCYINLVLTNDSIVNIEETVERLREMNVDGVNILKPFPNNNGCEIADLSLDDYTRLKELCADNRGFVRVENCFIEYWQNYYGTKVQCADCGRRTVFIDTDGRAAPCSKAELYYESISEMIAHGNEWEPLGLYCQWRTV